jgi:hypothetical protein
MDIVSENRQKDTAGIGYRMPGRPPKAPKDKVGKSVRCLVTAGVQSALEVAGKELALNTSDYMRLAIYRQLESDGKLSDEIKKDATWDSLRLAGLI